MNTKKIAMVTLMTLGVLTVKAQHEVGEWTIQPKLGFNLANIYGDGDNDKLRMGGVLGVEAEFGVAKNFGLSLGLLYSEQGCLSDGTVQFDMPVYSGGKVSKNKYSYDVCETYKLNYINVPVMANVYIAQGLALKLGVQLGFCVYDKVQVSVGGIGHEPEKQEFKDNLIEGDVNTVDFSIPVGLSYELGNVVLDARYQLGLTTAITKHKVKHSVFQFTVGYKIQL